MSLSRSLMFVPLLPALPVADVICWVVMLPFELLNLVFVSCLEGLQRGLPTFDGQRRGLSQVCGRWRAVINGNATFWTHFTVDGTVNFEALEYAMALSRDVGVSIRMHRHIVTRLRIHILDYVFVSSVRDLLAPGRFPRLLVLSLVVSDYLSVPIPDAEPIRAIDSGSHVSTIHIRHCRFAFPPHITFATLQTLVLRELGSSLSPSWTDFRTICGSAKGLRKLCVRYVACGIVPPDTPLFPPLSELVELDVAFGCSVSFAAILRLMRTPLLATFYFTASTAREADALTKCPSTLSTVTNFVLKESSGRRDPVAWDQVFSLLGTLTRLEIRSMESGVLHDLLYADRVAALDVGTGIRVCPNLARIGVDKLQPSDLVAIFRNSPSFVEALRWLSAKNIRVTFVLSQWDRFNPSNFQGDVPWVILNIGAASPRWLLLERARQCLSSGCGRLLAKSDNTILDHRLPLQSNGVIKFRLRSGVSALGPSRTRKPRFHTLSLLRLCSPACRGQRVDFIGWKGDLGGGGGVNAHTESRLLVWNFALTGPGPCFWYTVMSRDHGYRIAIGFGFVERTTCPVVARFRRVNTSCSPNGSSKDVSSRHLHGLASRFGATGSDDSKNK
ncbi:hypothetical protein C8J57DRAFT_1600562 [Mycena rebaudengoi]|nr:hypothetical protein C8J57DRAFT_1600562 [Mycena rebaudengoi]